MTPREIKLRMKARRITQTSLAKNLGVAPATVCTIIYGRSSSHRIETAIAEALGLTFFKVWGHHPKAIQTELNHIYKASERAGLNIEP
jgi:transcriptional regulator with XRE-family HTH domain